MSVPGHVRDKRYPHCTRLGVLRRTQRGELCISTAALYEELGWETYQKFLPLMKHKGASYTRNAGQVLPESCEEFLRRLNGK